MKILRGESPGYVLFDSETIQFKWSESKPESFDSEVLVQKPLIKKSKEGVGFRKILSSPLSVYIELTRTCTLACRHCFTSSSPKAPQGLNFEYLKIILDDLKQSGVINVRFTGGEPTIHPEWKEILGYAKSLGFVVSLQSNGAYRENEAAEIIAAFKTIGLDQISFSIDGHEKEHDYLRGKGNYRRTVNALKMLHENKLPARINTVLTPENIGSLSALLEDIAPFCQVLNLFQARPIGRASKGRLVFTSNELELLKSEIEGYRAKYPWMIFVYSGFPTPMKKSTVPFQMPRNYGFYSLTVSYDGRIWPHHYSAYQGDAFCLGSYVKGDRILPVWRESETLDRFRAWVSSLDQFCGDCRHFGSTCPGIDFEIEELHQSGKLETNPYCIHESPRPRF